VTPIGLHGQEEQYTREAIRAVVLKNLAAIGFNGEYETVEVNIGELKRQNSTSTRIGGAVTVHGTDRSGRGNRVNMWAKKVEEPARAFDAISAIYSRLEQKGIHQPAPKPMFYDPALGLLFMERIRGRCLLPAIAAGCVWPSGQLFDRYRERLVAIGRWMSNWHSVASVGKYTTLASMLPAIEGVLRGPHFSAEEKNQLRAHLRRLAGSAIAHAEWPLVTPHNDITLRNVFIDDDRFHVIDWDAMVHPSFPPQTIIWWDLITLLMNIESLMRLRPLISRKKLNDLCSSLWRGYMDGQSRAQIGLDEFRKSIMFVVVLCYYCGLGSPLPLYRIYKNNLGWRYTSALRRRLLAGSGSLF
jgi:tRNA A-37 threonylcarbamoyl transferase component Bud32